MKLVTAVNVIIITVNLSHIFTEDVDPGVQNLHDYYSCYFNKYFNLSSEEESERRDQVLLYLTPSLALLSVSPQFVTSLLVSAVRSNQSSPSDDCVSWMCDPHLLWRVWTVAGLQVWAYHTQPGNLIPSWHLCFSDNQEKEEEEEEADLWRHEVGRVSLIREDRLVFVPSVNCQDQGRAEKYIISSVIMLDISGGGFPT